MQRYCPNPIGAFIIPYKLIMTCFIDQPHFLFKDRLSFYSPGWPQTYHLTPSASQGLVVQIFNSTLCSDHFRVSCSNLVALWCTIYEAVELFCPKAAATFLHTGP